VGILLAYFKNILFVVLTLLALNSQAKDKLFHLAAGVYPPYTIEDGDIKGLNVEIIQAAFSAVGYQVKIELLPFTRAMHYAKNGKTDGLIIWHNKEREQWFHFSSVISQSDLVFYKFKRLKFDFNSLQSLMPYSIGTVANYAYSSTFLDADYLQKDVVGTDRQNINKLILGRIDVALIDIRMANYLIKNEHPLLDGKFDWSGVLQNEKYYLAVSKKAANYQQKVTDFNLGLQQITDNGVRAAIIKKYP